MTDTERDQRVGEDFWGEDADGRGFPDGMRNPTADRVPRRDSTWSDMNLSTDFDELRDLPRWPARPFARLVCRSCGGTLFEVLATGGYETAARCLCGYYYIVHSG